MSVINQLRAVHDEKHKNYFDRLQLKIQKNRTNVNSSPTVKKMFENFCVFHEPVSMTTKIMNHHDSLNHSLVARSNNI